MNIDYMHRNGVEGYELKWEGGVKWFPMESEYDPRGAALQAAQAERTRLLGQQPERAGFRTLDHRGLVRGAVQEEESFDPAKHAPWINPNSPPRTGIKVVFRRRGAGYGDMICILSAVQRWRELFPDAELHIDTIQDYGEPAKHHPDVDQIHTSSQTIPKDAVVMELKRVVGTDLGTAQPEMNRFEMFVRGAKIPTGKAPIPCCYLTQDEIAWATRWVHEKVGAAEFLLMCWKTRSRYKDYPHIEKLHDRLKLSHKVVILDPSGQAPGICTTGVTIRQGMAIMALARMVIGGDSFPMHAVGALSQTIGRKIPYFGLYGSQNPYFRQSPYQIPGSWQQGTCPHGRMPCVEQCCKPLNEHQPCMNFSPMVAERRILETLEQLSK